LAIAIVSLMDYRLAAKPLKPIFIESAFCGKLETLFDMILSQ
jgi:hypothetical protein